MSGRTRRGAVRASQNVHRTLGGNRHQSLALAIGVGDAIFRKWSAADARGRMRAMLKYNSKNYLQQDLPDHVFDCYSLALPRAKAGDKAAPGATETTRHGRRGEKASGG